MTAHRLVHVHGVQARCVEPGEPHVAHQHQPQRIIGVAEPLGERFPPRLVADMWLPSGRIGGSAGHHHLDAALAVIIGVPLRLQPHQLVVQVNADAPAHAHDHRLAVEHLQPLLEVRHDVRRHQPQPGRGADEGLQLCPLRLELLLALDLLTLGRRLEVRVNARPLGLVQGQLRQPALVVDRHRGPVLDRALDVVDADVVAEHRPRVGVL